MRKSNFTAAVVALLLGPIARADTIEVTSTTLVTAGQQTRGRVDGRDLVTVVPAFEILSITARDVRNPIADDLRLVFTGWGAYDFDDRRWDNGTSSSLHGDVVTGYIQGRLLDRRLLLRAGRAHVMTGLARMIHVDGGEATAFLPFGVRLSGYAGVPVSQRFSSRGGIQSWNPMGGDLAYGGRLAWSLPVPGIAGRGLDAGVSANVVEDDGDPVRRELGADVRVQPIDNLTFLGFGAFSLYDERFSEATVMATWTPIRPLHVTADWRYLAPELFLARNSILSVFAASQRNQFGAGASYELGGGFSVGGDYHLQVEPGETPQSSRYYGHSASGRASYARAERSLGAEVLYLDGLENGYVGGRIFGRQGFGRFFATADVLAHLFREEVNGEDVAVTGTLSAGTQLARGFSAVLSGRAGFNPYLEQTYDVMAKLVYNQSYSSREVR